ncbi:MAG: 4-hydroxy-tetrahydrodipicolinate synthase [Bacteroidia bacterium]|nr:4-hydroxy-tetrahydrodipicolinate synthase [Bacteroidia bacterium]
MISLRNRGVGTALVTPFTPDGSVDLLTMRSLVKRQIEGGVDMLIPCGTTGEGVTLTESEYQQILEVVVSEAEGRVPVIAGAGSNSTAITIRNARMATECGVDAVLIVGPYYNKPTQEGYYQHFRSVAESTDLGVVLYNVPGRTSGNMTAQTQLRLAEIDNIIGTKEASANFSQIMEILRDRPEHFSVLSGDDNLVLAQLAIGMDGVISVVSNEVPREFSEMVHSWTAGDHARARRIHYRHLKLMEINFIESNPIPVKTAMSMMGLLAEEFRLPLTRMGENNAALLRGALQELDLLQQ